MSDTPQGQGWWQAADGKWYAPEQHPNAAAAAVGAPTTTQPGQPGEPGQPDQPGAPDEPKSGRGKRIAIIVVVLLLLIAAAVAAVLVFTGGDDEDGDSGTTTTTEADIGGATGDLADDGPIEFDTEYKDALEGDRTEARYTLDAPDGAIMTLTVINQENSERPVFATFESAGESYAAFRVQPGASESERIVLDDTGGAQFELIFTEGPAAFSFEVGLEIQDDAGEGGDAGSELSSAFEISSGQTVDGLLGGDDETDHFSVELQPGTEFNFDAAVPSDAERGAFFTVELAGERLLAERVQPGADMSVSLLLADTDEGTVEIIVTEGPGDYSFTAAFAEQSEGGEDGDAPAELASARAIEVSAALEGRVGARDEGDYFTFAAPGPTFQVTGSAEATSERGYLITVEDATGSRVASFRVQPGAEASETVEVEAGSEVRLIVSEGPATYSISIG